MSSRLVFVLVLTGALVVNFATSKPTVSIDNLKLVIVIHRHGARAPIVPYPTDPYKNESFWPEGWGHLTNFGKKQMYQVGQYLAERYRAFLGNSPREVYARSTEMDRCLNSVSLVLAGLYPPINRWKWNSKLGKMWQPIPIKTMLTDNDGLLNPEAECPAFDQELEKSFSLSEVEEFVDDMKSLFAYVQNKTGMQQSLNIATAVAIFDTLKTEKDHNLTLPLWVTPEVYKKLYNVNKKVYSLYGSSPRMQQLRVGLLLNEVIQRIENPEDKQVYIYSTHDIVISTLLQVFEAYNNEPPPYGSSLLFEVLESEWSGQTIQAFYLNDTFSESPFRLPMKSCAHGSQLGCQVDSFKQSVQHLTLTNTAEWKKECQNDS